MNPSIQESLDTFLKNPSPLPKVVMLYGPTACGKTALSLDIAERLDSEIISVDSRQIYRHMDIGTGKIMSEEMRGIPHHMLDIIEATEAFSVVDFRDMATPILENLQQIGKIPVLCGGTGLYIDALLFERSYADIETDWDLRNELEAYRVTHGNIALWERLYAIDPEYAKILHPNNSRYVIRGIEVYTKTGQSKGAIQDTPHPKYDILWITPYDGDREKLYTKINIRVKEMFENGLVEEVEYIMRNLFPGFLQKCKNSPCQGLASIGYREVVDYLEGHSALSDCISLVQQHNRNYAKRQITWNKKYGT